MRDHRRRSRDRDTKSYRDGSRDRDRRRPDDSADSRRKRRDDSRDRPSRSSANGSKVNLLYSIGFGKHTYTELSKSTAIPAQTDEDKKAERLAKLEAWKQKQAAEKDRKQKEAESTGGTRNLLAEIDKKAQLSPAVSSPKSPATPTVASDPSSPAPYAGKFDPKAIAKKASAAVSNSSKLGTDVALPEIAIASATTMSNQTGLKANSASASANGSLRKSFSTFLQ